jgi:hypothetical protein
MVLQGTGNDGAWRAQSFLKSDVGMGQTLGIFLAPASGAELDGPADGKGATEPLVVGAALGLADSARWVIGGSAGTSAEANGTGVGAGDDGVTAVGAAAGSAGDR